jgi:hypothetical protein
MKIYEDFVIINCKVADDYKYWCRSVDLFGTIHNATKFRDKEDAYHELHHNNKIPIGVYQVLPIISKQND